MTQQSSHVSDQDLTSCLEAELASHFGFPRRITGLKRRRSEYCTSCSIEELEVRLDDGAILAVVFKDLSRASLAAEARRIRPAFVYDPSREILVYRKILASAGLGTATCYGSRLDRQADRYWLFLEEVAGVELYQVGEIAIWQAAAGWLARLHVTMRADAVGLANVAHLRSYDRDDYLCWIQRARDFVIRGADSKPGIVARIEWLANCYGRAVESLLELPTTLIHGEFYASNVLVEQTPAHRDISGDGGQLPSAPRVCPVDWETAAVAPGLIDLAALTAGNWSEEHREALTSAYRESWLARGGSSDGVPTPHTLDCCRLFLAVQWLGWAGDWSPPREHAQDWLGQAVELAERLNP